MDRRDRAASLVQKCVELDLIARNKLAALHDGLAATALAEKLNHDVVAAIEKLAEHCTQLSVLAREQEPVDPKAASETKQKLIQVEDTAKLLRRDLRKANIAYKKQKGKRDEMNRKELLSGAASRGHLIEDSSGVRQARDITSGLERNRRALAAQIEQSEYLNATLQAGSQSLRDTVGEMGSLRSTAGATRNTTTRIKRRERTDRILVALGMLFYMLVVLYILHGRVGARIWNLAELVSSVVGGAAPTPPENLHEQEL